MRDFSKPVHFHVGADGQLHDQYCRCHACKPGLDRAARARTAAAYRRIEVACAIVAVLLFAMIVARVALRV